AHAEDEALMVHPSDARARLQEFAIVDIRSREEFEAVKLPGALHFSQELLSEILTSWEKSRKILIVDHTGLRALDAAAFLAGHGFSEVKCLRGGIDAYSRDADSSLPRYVLE
ncbi:MAG: rhodanese-like domain-containing protein, partial [Terrimicrobiaceae bacterium]|nr:rhodanese-like domain-containing protein [Terrimicrobiaceae bacterium]